MHQHHLQIGPCVGQGGCAAKGQHNCVVPPRHEALGVVQALPEELMAVGFVVHVALFQSELRLPSLCMQGPATVSGTASLLEAQVGHSAASRMITAAVESLLPNMQHSYSWRTFEIIHKS